MTDLLVFIESLLPLGLTMVLGGGLGGFAAYLTTSPPAARQVRLGAYGFCLTGMIAALTVPLFLSLLQAKLLDQVKNSQDAEAYLILSGFSILAGFSAKTFLSTLSDRIINELTNKIENGQERAQVQIEELKDNLAYTHQQRDLPDRAAAQPLSPKLGQIGRTLTGLETSVLEALGRFAVRTAGGIADDCGIPAETVTSVIEKLISRGLAKPVEPTGPSRRLVALTEDGMELAAKLAMKAVP